MSQVAQSVHNLLRVRNTHPISLCLETPLLMAGLQPPWVGSRIASCKATGWQWWQQLYCLPSLKPSPPRSRFHNSVGERDSQEIHLCPSQLHTSNFLRQAHRGRHPAQCLTHGFPSLTPVHPIYLVSSHLSWRFPNGLCFSPPCLIHVEKA